MDQHIQAYFRNRDDAEEAAISLRALGVGVVETGGMETTNDAGDEGIALPFLAATGVPFAIVSREQADDEVDQSRAVVLSARVPDHLCEQAVNVVKQSGGWVD